MGVNTTTTHSFKMWNRRQQRPPAVYEEQALLNLQRLGSLPLTTIGHASSTIACPCYLPSTALCTTGHDTAHKANLSLGGVAVAIVLWMEICSRPHTTCRRHSRLRMAEQRAHFLCASFMGARQGPPKSHLAQIMLKHLLAQLLLQLRKASARHCMLHFTLTWTTLDLATTCSGCACPRQKFTTSWLVLAHGHLWSR